MSGLSLSAMLLTLCPPWLTIHTSNLTLLSENSTNAPSTPHWRHWVFMLSSCATILICDQWLHIYQASAIPSNLILRMFGRHAYTLLLHELWMGWRRCRGMLPSRGSAHSHPLTWRFCSIVMTPVSITTLSSLPLHSWVSMCSSILERWLNLTQSWNAHTRNSHGDTPCTFTPTTSHTSYPSIRVTAFLMGTWFLWCHALKCTPVLFL